MASIDIFNRKASVPDWMARWWEFDRAFSAKVMVGNWTGMTKEQAQYGAIQGLLVVAVAACGLAGKDRKSTGLPPPEQATIGLITEASAGNDPLLNQQLSGVKSLSGRADCVPQLVAVDAGPLGAETVGLCQVNTPDGPGTEVIVRKQKGGNQQTIKEMLTARVRVGSNGKPDMLFFTYGSGNQKENLFVYDVTSGKTEWILPGGGIVEFAKGQNPFEEMIGKILEPGNVAQAAEATQVYDPTRPMTITATPDGKLTITQPTLTETPTPTRTPKPTPKYVAPLPSPTPTSETDPFAGWQPNPNGSGSIESPFSSTIPKVCFDPKYTFVGFNNFTSSPDSVVDAIDIHNPPSQFSYGCGFYQGKVAINVADK